MAAVDEESVVEFVDFERKKNLKSSGVWKYFGFVKKDGIVDHAQVGCRLCQKTFKYSSTTTNMHTHLDRNHWREVHVSIFANCLLLFFHFDDIHGKTVNIL